VPLLGPLGIGERGVQDGDLVAEDLVQIGGSLRRQTDLRHEQNRRPARRQHILHGREVHSRLARAGDAEQQRDRELLLLDALANVFEGRRLCGIEREVEHRPCREAGDGEFRGLLGNLDDPAADERLQRGLRQAERAQLVSGKLSAGRRQRLHDLPLIFVELAACFS